nr:MAG TPA: hypothetical protein [Caudoviricetes sp.]
MCYYSYEFLAPSIDVGYHIRRYCVKPESYTNKNNYLSDNFSAKINL